jgi:hypothetical protein
MQRAGYIIYKYACYDQYCSFCCNLNIGAWLIFVMGNQVSLILNEIEGLQIWDLVAQGIEI